MCSYLTVGQCSWAELQTTETSPRNCDRQSICLKKSGAWYEGVETQVRFINRMTSKRGPSIYNRPNHIQITSYGLLPLRTFFGHGTKHQTSPKQGSHRNRPSNRPLNQSPRICPKVHLLQWFGLHTSVEMGWMKTVFSTLSRVKKTSPGTPSVLFF